MDLGSAEFVSSWLVAQCGVVIVVVVVVVFVVDDDDNDNNVGGDAVDLVAV